MIKDLQADVKPEKGKLLMLTAQIEGVKHSFKITYRSTSKGTDGISFHELGERLTK